MDEDLASMSREQLIDEVHKLGRGIRTRYRQSLDEQAPDAPRSYRPYDRRDL